MKHEVFISYARADEERVLPFVRLLVDRGWNVWWDQKVSPGVDYADRIGRVLDDSASTLVFWSESSVDSKWVKWEARHKLGERALVQVRLDPVELPFPFNSLQAIDHFESGPPSARTLSKLQHRFAQISGPRPVAPPVTEAAEPVAAPTVAMPTVGSPEAATPSAGTLAAAQSGPTPASPADVAAEASARAVAPARTRAAPGQAPPRRRAPWIVAGVLASLAVAWLIWGGSSPHRRPGVAAALHRPGHIEVAVDELTGCRYPSGWEIVDPTQGHDGWAQQVREPRSGIVFQLVPPGEFWMGSPPDEPDRRDNETRHHVTLTQAFYLGVTEVSWAQYDLVMRGEEDTSANGHWPVNSASWSNAMLFCREIGCDLPTEAQWEYAARAGSPSRWWWGDDPEQARGRANLGDRLTMKLLGLPPSIFSLDDHIGLAPVDSAEPNGFGLQNMIGNVMEWCADDYVEEQGSDPERNPVQRRDPTIHVARGGSYSSPVEFSRAASRLGYNDSAIVDEDIRSSKQTPETPAKQSGFRVALTIP